MIWAFDDEQVMFRDTLRDLLASECSPAVVRSVASGESASSLWSRFVDLGIPSMLVPAGGGGLGLDERWMVLLLEELGYAAVPHPIVETAAVAMPIVYDMVPNGATISTDLGSGLVPFAAVTEWFLLRTSVGAILAHRDDCVIELASTTDPSRRAGYVRGIGEDLDIDSELAFDRGAWATAAYLVGLAQRMIDLSVDYVSQRVQFGVPVGSFQAVKHHLADAAMQCTFARPAVHRASWSLATNQPTRRRDVSMAKAMASTAAGVAARQALQCHGAIGYTVEHDLHLFLKRSWALQRAWGDVALHRRRVAQQLGLAPIAGHE